MKDREAPPTLRVLTGEVEENVPAGSRLPAGAQSLSWFRDPVRFMERSRERRGDVFSVRLGALKRCTFIADADLAWEVLTGDPELMRMGSTNGIFRPVLGDRSLFLLDGEDHKRHRRLIMPAFHRGAVGRFGHLVAELAARDIATWPLDEPFPMQERMRKITLQMIFRIVMGVVDPRRDDEMRVLIHELLDLVQNPIAVLPYFQYELGGRTPFARLMQIVARLEALVYDEIGARRYDPGTRRRDDILSMLVTAEPHEPGFMSDREVRDELMTLLIAGHETTATALAWSFERLVRHPAALAKATEELELGDGDAYVDAVVRETLRQRPVLPITARKLAAPVQLGEWTFPKGWTLMPCVYLIHQDPEIYPEPERFLPERFLSDPSPSNRIWLPFGAGPRHCIGSPLSMMAVKVILRTTLSRAELQPASPEPEALVRRNFTLGPADGASVVMTRRLERRRGAEAIDPVRSGPAG